jgi:hypothetical protein
MHAACSVHHFISLMLFCKVGTYKPRLHLEWRDIARFPTAPRSKVYLAATPFLFFLSSTSLHRLQINQQFDNCLQRVGTKSDVSGLGLRY